MPEGPEVETVRRGLAPAAGRTIVAVETSPTRIFRRQSHHAVAETLDGARFIRFDRFGKYLLCLLDSGETMAVHLRMTGRFFLTESGGHFEHTHLDAFLDDGQRLLYIDPRRFGELFTFANRDRNTIFPELARLGPDVIKEPVAAERLQQLFTGRRRQLKAVLLDQTSLAGLGNIYVDESIFRAGLHPEQKVGDLTTEQTARLAAAITTVISEAVARGGSTLADGQYRRPDGTPGNAQDRHKVFGRAGRPCYTCATTLTKTKVAGRGTTTCPTCQPPP